MGKVMATRRKEVWVATRIADRTRGGFMFTPFSAEKMNQLRRDMSVLHDDMQHHLVGHTDGPTERPEVFWA